MDFWERLDFAIEQRGLSIAEAARLAQMEYGTLYKCIKEKRTPRLDSLFRLTKEFDLADFWLPVGKAPELDRLRSVLDTYNLSSTEKVLVLDFVSTRCGYEK